MLILCGRKSIFMLLLLAVLQSSAGGARGATITVGLDGSTSFSTVQAAINAAGDGDEIVVMPGRYVENLRILGKNIVLRSTAPHDLDVVKATILDGNRAGSVVTFAGTEGTTCVLSGFNITKGRKSGGVEAGGGILGNGTQAIIEHNFIYDNSAVEGGGIHGCNGIIQNNILSSNWAKDQMWVQGGGMAFCNGTIQNNIIIHNRTNSISSPFSSEYGGALARCSAIIQNNTMVDNSSDNVSVIHDCNGIIRNNIIWGNLFQRDLVLSSIPNFCNIESWTSGGEGNMSADPMFVDPLNDVFRLKQGSPCINSGISIPALPSDIEGNPRVGAYDIGAYEYVVYAHSRRWFLYH